MSSAGLHAQRDLFLPLLRGELLEWPSGLDLATFFDLAQFHGVTCLLLEPLVRLPGAPAGLIQRLQGMVRERAMWELRNRQLMSEALDQFAQAGIEALLYKGTALAYTVYGNPVWRMRGDSDVLVREEQLAAACAILESLGYRRYGAAEELIVHKLYFEQTMPEGGVHSIDLHWRLSNSVLLSGLFNMEGLLRNSVPAPQLSPTARVPDDKYALLIACMHRGVHQHSAYSAGEVQHYTGDRYIWLKDIDLLVRRLTPGQWQAFVNLAQQLGLVRICIDGLEHSRASFGTPLPLRWMQELVMPDAGPADDYLHAAPLGRAVRDLLACSSCSEKFRFIVRQLLPPVEYMRNKYAGARVQWLPWLYLRRIVRGLRARVRGVPVRP